MANKAKAMLDALMGSNRDVSKKDRRNDEFRDRNCCKHYLVGCCPNSMVGKKLDAIKRDPAYVCKDVQTDRSSLLSPEGCAKLHSPALRMQLSEHPKSERYRAEYEDDLRGFLKTVLQDTDRKSQKEKDRREYIREKEGTSGLGKDLDAEKVCETCGLRYQLPKKEGGVGYDDDLHDQTDVHIGFVKLRAKLTELEAKAVEQEKLRSWKAAEAERERNDGEDGADVKQGKDKRREVGSRSRSRQRGRRNDDRERQRSGSGGGGRHRQVPDDGDRGYRGDRDFERGRDRRIDVGNGDRGRDASGRDYGRGGSGRDYDTRSDRRRGGRD